MYNPKLFEKLLDAGLIKRIVKLHEVLQRDARKSVKKLFDDNDVHKQLLKAMGTHEFKEVVFNETDVKYALYDKLIEHANMPERVNEQTWDEEMEDAAKSMFEEYIVEVDASFDELAGYGVEQSDLPFKREEDND